MLWSRLEAQKSSQCTSLPRFHRYRFGGCGYIMPFRHPQCDPCPTLILLLDKFILEDASSTKKDKIDTKSNCLCYDFGFYWFRPPDLTCYDFKNSRSQVAPLLNTRLKQYSSNLIAILPYNLSQVKCKYPCQF